MNFTDYNISTDLRELILTAAKLENKTLITNVINNKESFNENHIEQLKNMYLHVPINLNIFNPLLCYKLVCDIDFRKVSELDNFINKNTLVVELEIYINQNTYKLESYQFKLIDRTELKTSINVSLTKLQETYIENYGKKCIKYYEKLIKEEQGKNYD